MAKIWQQKHRKSSAKQQSINGSASAGVIGIAMRLGNWKIWLIEAIKAANAHRERKAKKK